MDGERTLAPINIAVASADEAVIASSAVPARAMIYRCTGRVDGFAAEGPESSRSRRPS